MPTIPTTWAFCCVPPLVWCFLGTRERYQDDGGAPAMPVVEQVRAALGSRPYRVVIGIYLCSWLAVQITSAVLIFFITYWLQRPALIVPMLLSVQVSSFIFLFVWSAVSRRLGKRAVYIIGILFWLAVQAGLFFVPADRPNLALLLAALAGVGVAVAYLIPWSIMPDVIAHDQLAGGGRHEGIYYGLMVFAQKLGLALGLFIVGLALELQGFNQSLAPAQQPETALLAIRLLIGPVSAALLIGGLALASIYPITRRMHAQMIARLEDQ